MNHLTSQPARLAPPAPRHVRSMAGLRAEIHARGWNDPGSARIVAELAVHVLLVVGGAWMFLALEHPLALGAGALVCSLGSLGIGTNSHTASHGAAFRQRGLDAAFTFLGYPLLLGFSATYWLDKHVHVHHRAPNVVGLDHDIDLAPVFAILEPQVREARGLTRWWYRAQWLLVIPLIGLNAANMAMTGVRFLSARLLDPSARQREHWIDLGCLVIHAALWGSQVLLGVPPAKVLLLFALRMVLLGYALYAAFAPAHMPLEAACLAEGPSSQHEYVTSVLASTIDFRTGWLGRLLCSGVEYQIEHHLFPRVSHVHYPQLARLVREYCEHHHLPYRTVGWATGIWKSLQVFHVPKPVVHLDSWMRAAR